MLGFHHSRKQTKMEGQIVHVQHVRDAGPVLSSHRFDLCIVCPLVHFRNISADTRNSRNAEIGEDKQCRIGLKPAANIPLLIFDIVINVRAFRIWRRVRFN